MRAVAFYDDGAYLFAQGVSSARSRYKREILRRRSHFSAFSTRIYIEVSLIDEFKIRKQIAGIAASPEPPLRKARLILCLARRVRAAAHALGGHSRRSFQEGDTLRAARMREATDRLIETHAEIRAHAGAALAESSSSPLGEGSVGVSQR